MPLDLEAIRKIVAAAPQQLESKSCWQCGAPREYHGGEHGKEHDFVSWSDHQPLLDAMDELVDEVDRLQSERPMRMERMLEELTRTRSVLNALANAAGVDYGTASKDLESAAGKPEIDGIFGAYRYAASLVKRAVDRAGRKAEAELRARCLPVVEWTPVGRSYVAVVGRHEMIVVPDGTLSIWSFGWQLTVTGTQDDEPCSMVLDSGPETGEAGKAAVVAAWRRVCGLEAGNPGA